MENLKFNFLTTNFDYQAIVDPNWLLFGSSPKQKYKIPDKYPYPS